MEKLNYLTRWKIQLDSNDKNLQIVALVEILEFISMTRNLSDDYENVYVLIMNSDITHFLSNILSYQNKSATTIINKILCNFSETEEFFKNDFFIILKGYLRVINSIPSTIGSKLSKCYHEEIMNCVSIIIKRARERDYIFQDEQVTSLALNVFNLNKVHLESCPALDLINLTIELMSCSSARKENDFNCRNQKLYEVLRNLSTKTEFLSRPQLIILFSKILHNALNLIPSAFEMLSSEFKLIRAVVIDKFLAVMDLTLKENSDDIIYEVFLNLFYYFLTSSSLKQKQKMLLLNRLFSLKGHHYLFTMATASEEESSKEIRRLKSKIVIAEVLKVFVMFISEPATSEVKTYELISKSSPQTPIQGELHLESMMMFIFMRFIDFTWNNFRSDKDKADVFSNVALILTETRERKYAIEPAFTKMISTLFTSAFIRLSLRKNPLLKMSSKALLEMTNCSQIDLNYLRWWFSMLKPKKKVLMEVNVNFFNNLKPGQLNSIQQSDAKLFDLKLTMKMFLDNSTKIKLHNLLSQVLCIFTSINTTEYKKLLESFNVLRLSSYKKKHRIERLMNVMNVMNSAAESLVDMNVKQKTAEVLSKTLHQPSSIPHVKLAAVQIATNLLSIRD